MSGMAMNYLSAMLEDFASVPKQIEDKHAHEAERRVQAVVNAGLELARAISQGEDTSRALARWERSYAVLQDGEREDPHDAL